MLNSKTQPYQDNESTIADNIADDNAAQTLDAFLASVEQRAYRMAYIATSNKEDALDIVQDAMIMLVNKYSQRQYTEWPPLFHRIVQNTIRDWYRRQSVRNKFRQWFSGNGAADSDIEQDWESQVMQQAVNVRANPTVDQNQNDKAMVQLMNALNHLPVRQQQTFLLRCWEGLDTKQTAAAMSISEGSVKTHYSRAVHELRNQLGEHYGD
ncbi:hypothetical protein MNBD_GAMMA23-908 [hydrothermal vent metagenome]|uniref:RNA polymerase sigma factor 70 region 4 type 2 domain-containing protein n=1 Tax=hydrothermal vent metagenome TaxID=652676 RepID=A0A3B0ZXG9_9ZZZZ